MFTFDDDSLESMSNLDTDINYIKFKNLVMEPIVPTLRAACVQWNYKSKKEFQATDDLKIGHLTPGIYGIEKGIKYNVGTIYPIDRMNLYSGLVGEDLLFESGKLRPIFLFDEDTELAFNDCRYLTSFEGLPKVGSLSLVNCGEFRNTSCPVDVTRFIIEACQHLKSVKNIRIYKQDKHAGYEHSRLSFSNCQKLRNIEIESQSGSIDSVGLFACKDINISNKNVKHIQVLELAKTNFIHIKDFIRNLDFVTRFYMTESKFSDIEDLCELIRKSKQITIDGYTYYNQQDFWKQWSKEKLRKRYEYSAYTKIRRK